MPPVRPIDIVEPGNAMMNPVVPDQRLQVLRKMRAISRVMDSAVKVPGTSYRFGLDPIIGLIPGGGDVVTFLIAAYPLLKSKTLGLPRHMVARMAGNIALDLAVGAIPLLGDLFDFAFKANRRNLALVEKHLAELAHPLPKRLEDRG